VTRPTVLFVCIHNAGRSQIAEALFNAYAGGRARAVSAGVEPVSALSLTVVASMLEAGYDIRSQRPKLLDDTLVQEADRIVTLGCAEDPSFPSLLQAEDWPVEDPAIASVPKVREIRDEIARRVRTLLREMGIDPVR
jgi:protein-tyrosine-phosphatase